MHHCYDWASTVFIQSIVFYSTFARHALVRDSIPPESEISTLVPLALHVDHRQPFQGAAKIPLACVYPPIAHTLSRSTRGSDAATAVVKER